MGAERPAASGPSVATLDGSEVPWLPDGTSVVLLLVLLSPAASSPPGVTRLSAQDHP